MSRRSHAPAPARPDRRGAAASPWPVALAVAVPLLLASLAYARVLHADFLFDDHEAVVGNARLADLGATLRSFASGFAGAGRATTDLTFAVDRALWGPGALGFHVTNLLLHLAVTLAVLVFTRAVLRLSGRGPGTGVAVVVAGLFALHPMQSQAVSYVSQRSEVLASGLYLATLLAMLRADQRGPGLAGALTGVAALLLFVLGMGAKPILVTAPVAFLLLVALVPPAGTPATGEGGRSPWRFRLALTAPLLALGALVAATSLRAVEGRPDAGLAVPRSEPGSYFLTQWKVVATYLRLLAWPAGQSADWTFPLSRSLAEPAVLLSGLFLAAILAAAGYAAWRLRDREGAGAADGRAAAFGVLWFFLLLAPTSSVLPIADVLVEHRVYLASWGIFLAVALGGAAAVARLFPSRRLVAGAAAALVAWGALAAALHQRNAAWESDLALWTDAVEKAPGKARPRLGLGVAKARRGDLPGAVAEFEAGLARAPDDAVGLRVALLNDLGNALLQMGRPGDAVAPLRGATALDPSRLDPPQTLAMALWATGDVAGAAEAAEGVLARSPGAPLASRVLGQVLLARGDDGRAIPLLETAVRAQPRDPAARYDLGAAYANAGRVAEACASWRAVLQLAPGGPAAEAAQQGRAVIGCTP